MNANQHIMRSLGVTKRRDTLIRQQLTYKRCGHSMLVFPHHIVLRHVFWRQSGVVSLLSRRFRSSSIFKFELRNYLGLS